MAGFNRKFLYSPVAVLIAVNTLVFLIVGLTNLCFHISVTAWGALVGPFSRWILSPWGLLTYMFLQSDVIHLLFNMLWLFSFYSIISRMGDSRVVWRLYIASGLGGGLLFLLYTTAFVDGTAFLIGASASVLGAIAWCAVSYPTLPVNLFLFGEVRLIWIAAAAMLLCGIAPGMENPPSLLAHLGGLLTGGVYALIYRRRLVAPRIKISKNVRRRTNNVRLQEKRGLKPSEQAEIDALLDRVRKSGYKSLGTKERARLFELSNRIKN